MSVSWEQSLTPDGEKVKAGRLVVFLIRPDAKLGRRGNRAEPMDVPFERDPQPLFGAEVAMLGEPVNGEYSLGENTQGFLGSGLGEKCRGTLKDLPPGSYRAQVALIINRDRDWKECAGNLYSEAVTFEVKPGAKLAVKLTNVSEPNAWPKGAQGAEEFVLKSKVLSEFWKKDVLLRAGVRFPTNYDPKRKYPVVYEIPGFGGDHLAALWPRGRGQEGQVLARNSFYVVLDPNSPYGHTFFMNSDTIGPWADALRQELIPALEAKYPLIANANARLLTGHSSGGWSTLWLATEYPETFGATWSTSPDPVDFRRFELVDMYGRENFFKDEKGETPSARIGGDAVTQTIREESTVEDVLGPNRSSAQQWASWQACWGTRQADGRPTPLFDPVTGVINKVEAETYRRFDIGHRLRTQPAKFIPLFRKNVRLLCGTKDDYFLEEAVKLLKADLEKLDPEGATKGPGYIELVEGATHSSLFGFAPAQKIPGQMVEHLRSAGIEIK